ncbi:MAG: DegQ family serine endoprotease [Fibromonadaceae bacterium]|jgi:serine protease Do|nr:DegQ family serine endoprotease [Fibromonadaceae bacterium]
MKIKCSHLSPTYLAISGAIFFACSAGNATPSSSSSAQAKESQVQAAPTAARAATPQLEMFRYELADLADKLIPAVVSIQTETTVKIQNYGGFFGDDFFDQFFNFGPPRQQQKPRESERKQTGQGSGVIVSSSGQILTNDHVVEGADQITVVLSDKREFKAKVVGTDKQTDIAVLQIESEVKDLPVASLGNSDALRVGEWVIAIGNPFGLSQTVTKGIVSAKGVHNRGITSYENFIQTDAAINPGNSGGGLFNLSGELIGVNTAILSRSGGFQGIGFAIPVNLAKSIMGDLLAGGKVNRGWLGVSIQDINPSLAKALNLNPAKGALISEIFENSPAEKSGVKVGDVVRSINGKAIEDANDLRNTVAMLRPGESAEFEILREGKALKLKVNIALRDENSLAGVMPDSKEPKDKKAESGKNEWGIQAEELTKAQKKEAGLSESSGGVLVVSVAEKSPAEKAGVKKGDIILVANHKGIANLKDFNSIFGVNSKTMLILLRRGSNQTYMVLEK